MTPYGLGNLFFLFYYITKNTKKISIKIYKWDRHEEKKLKKK